MRTVIIVNGKPRAGKDSTVEAMTAHLQAAGIQVRAFSSIDPVRDMLASAGVDVTKKTPEDRALLAEIGDSLEKHSHWRSAKCRNEIRRFFATLYSDEAAVMFLHVREPAIINRIIMGAGTAYRVLTVLVQSPRAENVTSNAADMNVDRIMYDTVIYNDSTLEVLNKLSLECLRLADIIPMPADLR